MEKFSLTKKISVGSSRLRIIGLLFMMLAFVSFIYLTKRQGDSIEVKENQIVQRDQAIAKKDAVLANISVEKTREELLLSRVNEFLRLRALHDVDSLDALFSDHIEGYFKNLKNAPKTEIKRLDRLYWAKYPNDKFVIARDPEVVINEDGTAKAIVKGDQCRDGVHCIAELLEIEFDPADKIKSVRAFYAR